MKKIFFIFAVLLIFPFNLQAASYTYDLGLNADDISFSKELVSGQKVRIYAGIHNYGAEDTSAYVTFYQSNILIGDSQIVSVRAGGVMDEVYVDFTVPNGSFNIRAEIHGQDPGDENPNNDVALTTLFNTLPDTDGDGIPDVNDDDDDNDGIIDTNEPVLGTDPLNPDSDNDGCLDGADDFPLNPQECIDTDGDGIGDNQDNDNDNDGLSDSQETQINTDPFNPDTDGDGVIDSQDYCPGDSQCSQESDVNTSDEETTATNGTQTLAVLVDENINSDIVEPDLNSNINQESGTQLNSNLLIRVTQKNWNTYVFSPEVRGVIDDNLSYQWDFGDGVSANQKIAEHQFDKLGDFNVALKVSGKNNLDLMADKKIRISFFNLDNKLLWALTGSLLFLLLILLAVFSQRRKR